MHYYYHTIQIKYDNKYTALPNDIHLNITHSRTYLMILYHIKAISFQIVAMNISQTLNAQGK